MTRLVLSVGILAALGACAQAQRPVTFKSHQPAEQALDTLVRTLAEEGQSVERVDHKAGVVETQWQDTGFLYGQVQNQTASLVRRYVAVVAPSGSVTLRVDVKRCAQGGFTIGSTDVRGACEAFDGVVTKQQEELDALGARLQGALDRSS